MMWDRGVSPITTEVRLAQMTRALRDLSDVALASSVVRLTRYHEDRVRFQRCGLTPEEAVALDSEALRIEILRRFTMKEGSRQ